MQHHFHFHLHHHARHHARYDVDMTQGSTTRHLVRFALPLLAGNLFQQLYNMVDTWVVGNFVSNEAFSAVGTVTPIINTLIGFFLGMSSGAGVVISQYYGAHRPEKVREAVHTAMLLTVIMGVVFTGVGIAMTPLMLELMKTPAEVAPDQTAYLTIYFAGIMGLLLYNMGSGILRAVGDSQRPFYFLLVSAGVNTALDLLFVLKFGMGVEGVAYATIIAQAVSAVLTIAVLIGYDGSVKLSLRDLRIHWRMLKKIVAVGIPAALQMAITAFSNVFVQGYINHFGADCMSGWTAYTKIDQLVILPVQSLSLASTTFVGQNLGVGDVERAKGGVRRALYLSFAVTAVLLVPVLTLAPDMTAFFNSKPEVVSYGALLLRLLSPFYFFFCINQIYSGALRGSGNSQVPMFIMLGSFVVFRQIYLYVMAHFISNEIVPIAMGYPAGWFVCSAVTLLYYAHCKFDSHRLVEDV
ncbi:MAG: MATE family efflux transporter [Oscillospiraceae bacterium]